MVIASLNYEDTEGYFEDSCRPVIEPVGPNADEYLELSLTTKLRYKIVSE